jgi:O-antigen/teichoic acid export membrane protein
MITSKKFRLFSSPRRITKPELRQGSTYCLMHIVAVTPSEIDKIALTQYIGAHDAGIYASASRVLSALMMPIAAILLATQPKLFRHVVESSENTPRLVMYIAAWTLACGLFAVLAMLLASPVLPYLFGNEYISISDFAPLLAFSALPFSLRFASANVLVALGHPAQRVVFEIFGIVALLLSISGFTPDYGLRGAAIALFLAETFMAILGWILVFRAQRTIFRKVTIKEKEKEQ